MSKFLKTGNFEGKLDYVAFEFPYKCDDFQLHSFNAINNGDNLLVTAHTGAGKTTVAEYAIVNMIKKGKRVIVTSPIKSLSNEKYSDFKKKFEGLSDISVGILTGDNKINPDGNCLIMTAEILRNSLYRLKNITLGHETNITDNLGCVIMDEVHFINDKDRGKVWEETLVLLNMDIQIIMLSATIDKPEQFASWVGNMKQKNINLITTTHRIIPLTHYVYLEDKLHLILDSDGNMNRKVYDACTHTYANLVRKEKHKNMFNDLIGFLKVKNATLMPCIFFMFSKKKCELYANKITCNLIDDHKQITHIEGIFNKHMHSFYKQYSSLDQFTMIKDLLLKGIGVHHSGILPVLREIVEILFHEGLIKILFATETFAVGVNMPTKTVIFTDLCKHTKDGRRLLNSAEYKQMSGRAGRRGIDKTGTVIILPSEMPTSEELTQMMLGKVSPIKSTFVIDYSFYLKAIHSDVIDIRTFVGNSLLYKEHMDMISCVKKDAIDIKRKMTVVVPDNSVLALFNLNKIRSDNFIKLNKVQQKQLSQLQSTVDCGEYNRYVEYVYNNLELKKCQKIIDESDAFITVQISKLEKFLTETGYIIASDEASENKLTKTKTITKTKKSILSSQINECNCILLTEMIVQDYFKNFSAEDIITLLAVFIEDDKDDFSLSIDKLKIMGATNIKDNLYYLEDLIYEYKEVEKKYDINNPEDYWNISYNFIEIANCWAHKKELKLPDNMYIGNFIKNMIKINNIAKDMVSLVQINGDSELLPELNKVDGIIMREWVSVNSLYL